MSSTTNDSFAELSPAKSIPQISILMPLYNQEAFVEAAITSVLHQEKVVAEILISDDCSTDRTYEVARNTLVEAVERGHRTHRILLRRGSVRLWRDHLPHILEHSSCDLVCQAHGDDLSRPDRAATVVAAAKRLPRASMFVSRFGTIDGESGVPSDMVQGPGEVTYRQIRPEIVLASRPFLYGFSQSWRRGSVIAFGRLDRSVAPTSHDLINAFRASMAGGVILIDKTLVLRRRHSKSASQLMFGGNERPLIVAIDALSRFHVSAQDIEVAGRVGLLQASEQEFLLNTLSRYRAIVTENVVREYRSKALAHWKLKWEADEL